LNEFFDGHAYIYGPLNTEHWFLYVADYSQGEEAAARSEFTLEIMMHRMDPSATPQFFRTEEKGDKDKMPGIADLLPGSETDEFNFTPCGYSMNGLKDEAYWTIHVTPEDHCSYASFETNVRLFSAAKLNALVQRVIGVFKPGVMTVSLFTSNKDNARPALELPGYMSRHRTVTEMESCGAVTVWNFETHEIAAERNNGALMRKRSWRAAYNARRAGKQSDSDEEANRDESFDFRRNIMSPSSDVSSRMSEEEREENRHSPRIAGIADHDNSDNSDGELSGN
jgi:S-adenosylmethionine decarboxylase